MGLADYLFASSCKICGKSIDKGAVCSECNDALMSCVFVSSKTIDTSFGRIDASYVFDYDNEVVKKLLFALKRYANKELFMYAARMYSLAVPSDFCGIVTNVPRRKVSKRNYGYDHVKQPCKFLSKLCGEGMNYMELLRRKGFSKDQKALRGNERKENARDKFAATKKDITCDILLVDDVVTTKSTIISCAEAIARKNPNAKLHIAFLALG